MGIDLRDYQLDAVNKMKNGCILKGGVGSGKSRTSLAYYYKLNGGDLYSDSYVPMNDPPLDLYIITTARKRDTLEWDQELVPFLMSKEGSVYMHTVVIDSWNNIGKYSEITDAFFIFDEQRVVGSGSWVKTFLKITKNNKWILLSATPGDTWQDYIPVFLANGFFKNKTEFLREHVVFNPRVKFPKIDRYVNTGKLERFRRDILVDMDFVRETNSHKEYIQCVYDTDMYKKLGKSRWNPYKEQPIENASELCYTWRKIVNSSESRQVAILEVAEQHERLIIFYNFDYELEILRGIPWGPGVIVGEYNGHKHDKIPETKRWVYLVQYTAGCEGWNCIETNAIAFYSLNYSYKVMEQASGRINRMNTKYTDLYYYYLRSNSPIDIAINRALNEKRNFNESSYVNRWN